MIAIFKIMNRLMASSTRGLPIHSLYVALSLHGLKIYRFLSLEVGLILSKSMG